jgi:glycosyltransferase involved in cell wall biosynthesis
VVAPGYTVIVPAHQEQASIVRALEAFAPQSSHATREVIVVCNGCTDSTAERARGVDPAIRVIEIPERGKWRAINEGYALRSHASVIVVDADVAISADSLDALALALLREGTDAVSPDVAFEFDQVGWPVRAYYRVYRRHPYLQRQIGGAGVYGLSQEGGGRILPLPAVISDDGYVRARIPPQRQKRVLLSETGYPVLAHVRPPRTLVALLRSEARWRRGDQELRAMGLRFASGRLEHWVDPALWAGSGFVDALVYLTIKCVGRVLSVFEPLRPGREWRLDQSSRN